MTNLILGAVIALISVLVGASITYRPNNDKENDK